MVPTPIKQLITIKPFFNSNNICVIKETIRRVEKEKLTYRDYSGRTGIIWTDFWVNTQQPEIIRESKNTVKHTRLADKLVRQKPESVFNYPKLQKILCQEILPMTFALIRTEGWTRLPQTAFAQFFLQRCHTSEAMDWHQDPGEDYDTVADFSLVIMLSHQNNDVHGWQGGQFKIKAGLPNDTYNESDVTTLTQQFNQAILFNNKINSHSVTAITSSVEKTERDIIVVPIYLGKLPDPVVSNK